MLNDQESNGATSISGLPNVLTGIFLRDNVNLCIAARLCSNLQVVAFAAAVI